MDDKIIKEKFDQICNLLYLKKLKQAFDIIDELILVCGNGDLRDHFEILEQDYRHLLKYTIEGINDPERQNVYARIIVSSFELTDQIFDYLKLKYSTSYEYNKKRSFSKFYSLDQSGFNLDFESYLSHKELQDILSEQNTVINDSKLQIEHEKHVNNLISVFYHFWFTNRLNKDDIDFIKSILENSDIPFYEKSLLISSLTLSLVRYFEESKFNLLIFACDFNELNISIRAIIGLLINMFLYDKRIPFYHILSKRLNLFMEDSRFKSSIEKSILHFIGSKETEKIKLKLQNDIFPEMIRLSPNLRNKLNLESLLGEGISDEKNPEWQEILNDSSNLIGKIEELTRMQLDGADVFLGSFSMLKMFPFFNELANWFLPFAPEHPELCKNPIIMNTNEDLNFKKLISSSSMLCNSDKYSFYFSLMNIPTDYFKLVSESLKAEKEQFDEDTNINNLPINSIKTDIIISHYIRDLYRFYKIHPQHDSFDDIFNWNFDFQNKFVFARFFEGNQEILKNIAEFNFVKNCYHEALETYLYLNKLDCKSELFQKIAYCYQKIGNYNEALNYYLNAELFDQNKFWCLKMIASCYRNLKNPLKAMEYYNQAAVLQPENLSLHILIGQCQMELENYKDALKSFFKVEYLSPGNKQIWRPIGWCSYLSGKLDQAERYFERLIKEHPNKFDLLNMGHIQWSLGNRIAALNFYKQSIRNPLNSEKEFMEAFDEDITHLLNQGVNQDDIPIILDQLLYFLEKE